MWRLISRTAFASAIFSIFFVPQQTGSPSRQQPDDADQNLSAADTQVSTDQCTSAEESKDVLFVGCSGFF